MSDIIQMKKRGRPPKNQRKSNGHKSLNPKCEEDIILHIPIHEDNNDKDIFTTKDDDADDISSIDSLSGSDANNESVLSTECRADPISATYDYKFYYTGINLISIMDGKCIIPEKTNIACWWDCYEINNMPFFLPDKFYNGIYYVFGCFCSPNCAMAYNLHMNDNKTHNRYSLVKRMIFDMYGKHEHLHISPPKEILEKFGGPLSISQFRNKFFLLKKEIVMTIPSMVPLQSIVEEYTRD